MRIGAGVDSCGSWVVVQVEGMKMNAMKTASELMNLGSDEWPTCLNCGELCLSDGTCLNRQCLRDRLDEAMHRASWQCSHAKCAKAA